MYFQVDEALSWLKTKDVWSRGRFGAFTYEMGDVESCFMQGVEAVDNILDGTPENIISQHHDIASSASSSCPCYDMAELNSSIASDADGLLNTDHSLELIRVGGDIGDDIPADL